MRLAKLAVASVSPTVGAVTPNRARLDALARAMAAEDVTLAAFPEQVDRRLSARGPGAVARLSRRAAPLARARSPPRPRTRRRSSCSASPSAVGGAAVQLSRRSSIAGASSASSRRRSSPPTTCSTKAAPSRAAARACRSTRDGIPLGDFVFAFDFGTVAVEVCEDAWSPDGPMRRRSLLGRRDRRQRVGLAVPDGHRQHAARDARDARPPTTQTVLVYANAVGGQDGLIYDGGGFVFPERPSRVRGAALRATAGGRRWSISIARSGCAWRTPRGAPTAKRSCCTGDVVPAVKATAPTADRSRLPTPLPMAAASSCRPAGRRRPDPRDARSTTSSRRSRSA